MYKRQGTDRLTDLAQRVSTDDYWIRSFHRWMLAMVAQWMGLDNTHANSVAPILVSRKQGKQKSTYVKLLKLYLAIENTLYLCIKDKINNEKSYRLYSCFY